MQPYVTANELQQIKNMLTLSNLSYDITNSQLYTVKPGETNAFKNISPNVTFIAGLMEKTQTISLISLDKKILYVSFAGTHDTCDEINDIKFMQIYPKLETQEIIKFHEGFYKEFMALKDAIKNVTDTFIKNGGTSICLSGHSSGGCVASITAYYLKQVLQIQDISVVTFGSPYFTNFYGSKWYALNTTYTRVEINRDPIPTVPEYDLLAAKYFHVLKKHIFIKNNKIYFNKNKILDNKCNFFKLLENNGLNLNFHKIETYKSKLENIILN